jgi:curved DNA-binding protein CbpA
LREVLKRHALSRKEAEPLLAALLSTGILVGSGKPAAIPDESSFDGAEDLETRRQNFFKDLTWMMEQDFFTLLGVSESDSREQVRRSYHKLAKTYHPDRFFEQDGLLDLQDKVNMLFQRITDAYETLSDASARASYIRRRQGKAPIPTTSLETILQAETAFQKGKALFRNKKYADAEQAFAAALSCTPNEAEYLMYRAWSAYKAAPQATETVIRSRRDLVRAAELNPRLSLAQLYLGYIGKAEGDQKEAQRRFERAVNCDPNCTEALRELRLMSMRKATAGKEKKGLFGRIFD